MADIADIKLDPRFQAFCALACEFERDYGVKVWHSNRHTFPIDADLTQPQYDVVEGFYKPLEKYGYNLDYQVYCYGSPTDA